MNIVQQLKDTRIRKGYTQAFVAEHMNTTASAVARLESGGGRKKHSPSLETLKKYAAAIRVNINMTLHEVQI